MTRPYARWRLACPLAPLLLVAGALAAPQHAEVQAELGHASAVQAIQFSSDGRRLVSGASRNVRLWSLPGGLELRSLDVKGMVHGLALAEGSHRLVIAADDLEFWDEDGKAQRAAADPVAGGYTAVAVSADGRTVYSAGIRLEAWDVATGTLRRSFGPVHGISSLVLAPDGRTLAVGGAGVEFWDVARGTQLRALAGLPRGPFALAFSPDGRTLAMGVGLAASDQVVLWDVASGTRKRSIQANPLGVTALSWSPDGKVLATSGLDQSLMARLGRAVVDRQQISDQIAREDTLRLISPDTGTTLQVLRANAGTPEALAWSPDSHSLAAGNGDGSIVLWTPGSAVGRRLPRGSPRPLTALALTPDGRSVAIADSKQTVHIWDLATGRQSGALEADPLDQILGLALSPDGSTLAAGGRPEQFQSDRSAARLHLWDMSSLELKSVGVDGGPMADSDITALAFSPNGRALALLMGKGLRLWLRSTGTEVDNALAGSYDRTVNTRALAYAPDGRTIVAGRPIRLWDTVGGGELRPLGRPDPSVVAVAYSPDGRIVATGGKRLALVDVATGAELRTLADADAGIAALAFAPDGRTLVTGGAELRTWDVASGRPNRSFVGHGTGVSAVGFTVDGARIVSTSRDGTARLWDARSGAELLRMVSFTNGEWIAITPEGYYASSLHGHEFLDIRIDDEVDRIDQFYDVFYRPDIVQARLAGQDIAGLATLTIDDVLRTPPPRVEFTRFPDRAVGETARVCYRITSTGGGIGEIRVFQNGKLVRSDGIYRERPGAAAPPRLALATRNGASLQRELRELAASAGQGPGAAAPAKPNVFDECQDLFTTAGENEISVAAFNAAGTVQSPLLSRTLRAARAPERPRLYVLAIGIDHYHDAHADLQFAGKDAHDFLALMAQRAGSLFAPADVRVVELHDANADKAGILSTLQSMAAQIRPADVFVLFVASHGVLLDNQYFMVTAGFDGTADRANFISSNEIVEMSKNIRAFSQWFVFDTCHAGGVDGVVSGLYDARMSVLARKLGLHIFASAQSDQLARDEFEGNGLFTHVLLGNMRDGHAARDGALSVTALGRETRSGTIALSKGTQAPDIIDFGRDFPLFKVP
jgi:WD40 repeat protein